MIWFTGILQDTRNKTNESKRNKQTKKTELWVWCLLHSYAHCLTLRHICVLYCKRTNNKSFISGTSTSKIIIFQFFWTQSPFFFLSDWKHIFWARPLKIAQAFFLPLDYFFGCVIEETHAQPTWKLIGIAKCRVKICNWVVRN